MKQALREFRDDTFYRRFALTLIPLGMPLLLAGCGESARQAGEEQQIAASPEERRIEQGRQQARMCIGCHGPEGRSRVESYPSLAGLDRSYLAEQLHAFRSGERDNPMMSSIARNLDDEAIAVLSAYFATREAGNE
ncbi:c-type cytochrome [Marinimicrobium sp. ARAG 43.8]|uniref:c-type cytochrome n=1 Tax=Marinimicrobium sp. ARAG 43.8 TaxID=3418719 RepID=UPI003CF9DCE2